MLIQILGNPDLYRRVRAEVKAAGIVTIDKSTGKTHIDTAKLDSLPLLLSVFLECLRLYMTIIVTRTLRTDLEIDGYTLRAGNNIITPSCLAHYNENAWPTPGHPASTFWAERFLQKAGETGTKDPFKKDRGDFFPFGGGLNICPGRHRGKTEILSTVAALLAVYEFDFVGYVDKNGRPTTKGPEHFNIEEYECRGVAQPDRDVVVRMRRAV
jgi:cytochrome P450